MNRKFCVRAAVLKITAYFENYFSSNEDKSLLHVGLNESDLFSWLTFTRVADLSFSLS